MTKITNLSSSVTKKA
uniref:Uncharacterized protein n=1 Tax=Rhizophora mucronata TaxID=61149 RepID=A0A2P2KA43_RHIMU